MTEHLRAELPLRTVAQPEDVARIRALVEATGMFSLAEVAIAGELAEEFLAKGEGSGYRFLIVEDSGRMLGYACYGPIPGTQSSYDLYWIAVQPDLQGRGLGRTLLRETERAIREAGGTRVYVDTSGRGAYAPTRAFYEGCGYTQAAWLPDFYGPGDAKVVYMRVLAGI